MDKMAQKIYDQVLSAIVVKLKNSGLTQDELADRCGLTQPTMHRLIAGQRGQNLPFRTILQIALAFDIDLGSLIFPHPPEKRQKIKTLLDEIGKMIANE